MNIKTTTTILFFFFVIGSSHLDATQATTTETAYPDLDKDIQPLKDAVDTYRKAKLQLKELEIQVGEAHNSPSPEIVQFHQKIERLQEDRDQAAAKLALANGGMWSGYLKTIAGLPSLLEGVIVFLFSLVAFYLWNYKRDLSFTIFYSEMRCSLSRTIKPSGVKPKSRFGKILLITVLSILLLLLAMLTTSVWAAQEQKPIAGILPWDVQKQNFDQNVIDYKALKTLSGYSRLAFILEKPVYPVVDLATLSPLWGNNGLIFNKEPALTFNSRRLKVNSFEYLFLAGRSYYEDGKLDNAFQHFLAVIDLKQHPFENRIMAEKCLLNLLEIAILSNKISQFDELERQLLENASIETQLEFADFLVFKADKKKGLGLFQRTIIRNIKPAMDLLSRILAKLGSEDAYFFCKAAFDELNRAKQPPDMLVELLNNNWSAIATGNSAPHQNDYVTLLKDATGLVQNSSIKLKSLQLLLDLRQNDFVRIGLNQIMQQAAARLTISDYLSAIAIYQKLGENADASKVLESAIYKVFSHDAGALFEIFQYCLKKDDLEWANKSLEAILTNSPRIGSNPTDESLLEHLKIKAPLPWEPFPLSAFWGLLQDRMNNHGEARLKLESSLKPDLERALEKYNPEMELNINVLYFLLKKYQELKDTSRFRAIYPIYQDTVANYWEKNEKNWRQKMEEIEKRVSDLEKQRHELVPTPEEMKRKVQGLEEEIRLLNQKKIYAQVRTTIHSITTTLIHILAVLFILSTSFYVLCRAAHHARLAAKWKTAVFLIRFHEGCGFALMMTVVLFPIGAGIVLLSQSMLTLFNRINPLVSEEFIDMATQSPPNAAQDIEK